MDIATRPAYNTHELESLAMQLLTDAGLTQAMALTVANTLIEGDLLGHDTHGLALLAGYLKELQSGAMTASGSYTVVSDKPATSVWDGQRLPGPWLIEQGLDMLMPRARELGVASLVIRRSHHIACLAVYLMRSAQAGFLTLLASSDANSASVAPMAGHRPCFRPTPCSGLSLFEWQCIDRYFGLDHHQWHE